MLGQFEVQGFRCFRDFRIAGLKRINLIAGKNGVGKSALLEALRLYLKPHTESLLDILEWRDAIAPDDAVWRAETILPLFHDSLSGTPAMTLRADRLLQLRLAWHRRDDDGTWQLDTTPLDSSPRDAQTKQVMRFEYPNESRPYYFLPLDGSIAISEPSSGARRAEQAFLRYAGAKDQPAIYLRSDALDSDAMSDLFERIVATDMEDQVNSIIRWIVPDAERLLTKGAGTQRMLFVKRNGVGRPEPLKRFGDGAMRLTAIALALTCTRNGFCLIDEIENGIHYELFDDIWEKISLMSARLNVQVFATTHSKDCIDAFERAYRHPDFDACFFRLERDGDALSAVRLDYQSFFSVFEGSPHEVR
ncbi:MAG: ATP-binding protein [Acidobacteria bacterium]|nr:ATP-binding protein [Acidobacteriota bacterium]